MPPEICTVVPCGSGNFQVYLGRVVVRLSRNELHYLVMSALQGLRPQPMEKDRSRTGS